MPKPATVHRATVWEDSGLSIMDRVYGPTAALITQAALTSITATLFLAGVQVQQSTLTIATVVFDTLQTDARWTLDATGYNFRHDIAAAWFAVPGKYRMEYKFDPVTGEDWHDVWAIDVLALLRS